MSWRNPSRLHQARHSTAPVFQPSLRAGQTVAPPPPFTPPVLPGGKATTPAVNPQAIAPSSVPSLFEHTHPLARRTAPRPLAPPDLVLIAALTGWPGAVGGLLAIAVAIMIRRVLPRGHKAGAANNQLAGALAALPPPTPPTEPRLPKRAICREAQAAEPAEPRLSGMPLPLAAMPMAQSPGDEPSAQPANLTEANPEPTPAITIHRQKAGRKSNSPPAGAHGLPPRPLDETLSLVFEPLRFSATLTHAVLPYRLSLTHGGPEPLGPVSITGEMIGAEPALPSATADFLESAQLPVLHTLPALPPGETTHLRGEFRMPLGSIAPMRVGAAVLMVPVIRLKVEAGTPPARKPKSRKAAPSPPLTICQLAQFVVGEPDENGTDRLHPFRLDLGPRSWAVAALGGLDLVA